MTAPQGTGAAAHLEAGTHECHVPAASTHLHASTCICPTDRRASVGGRGRCWPVKVQ